MLQSLRAKALVNRRELTRFLKFAVVGTLGAVVDFSVLYLLHIRIGFPLVLANTVSFTSAVLSNFTWNRLWTYPDSRSKPLSAQLGQFFAVNIIGWGINTSILAMLSPHLTTLADAMLPLTWTIPAHTVGYNSAKVVATGVVMFWNFFVNRYWTYNDVD